MDWVWPGTDYILVRDESPEILSLIEIVLREDGFAVQTAVSNLEALRKAKLAAPLLVLLDVGLSPTTDEMFVAAIRELYGPRVPFILVSAICEPALQAAVRRTGAVDVIRKPFDIDDLLFRVRRGIDGIRTNQGLSRMTPRSSDYEQARMITTRADLG